MPEQALIKLNQELKSYENRMRQLLDQITKMTNDYNCVSTKANSIREGIVILEEKVKEG